MQWQWLAHTSIRLREEMNWRFSWMLRSLCRSYSHRLSSWDYKQVCMGMCVCVYMCVTWRYCSHSKSDIHTVYCNALCSVLVLSVCMYACVCVGGCMCNLEHCRRLFWGSEVSKPLQLVRRIRMCPQESVWRDQGLHTFVSYCSSSTDSSFSDGM